MKIYIEIFDLSKQKQTGLNILCVHVTAYNMLQLLLWSAIKQLPF